MDALVYAMIYAGSALMVYNIVRCYGFVMRMRGISGLEKTKYILPIPLALLVMFLIGYLAVALLGEPDLIIASILLGGSVFVFIVFGVMYLVIDRLRESNARSDALYEEIRTEIEDLTKDCLSVFRVNLTKDAVEEYASKGVLATYYNGQSYTDLLESLNSRFTAVHDNARAKTLFTREGLLKSFEAGVSDVEETLCVLVNDDTLRFVKMKALLATQPGTGDVVAFITETICEDELVNDVLLSRSLVGQYDVIASLLGGRYRVVIGDKDAKTQDGLFPANETGDYGTYLTGQVAPALCAPEDEKATLLDALSIDAIERELAQREPYELNFAISNASETRYKRFSFYTIDRAARFFLLLESDTTESRREEMERNAKLAQALEEAQIASQSKTTFLSNISHDIRTPMNAIVGYTRFAQDCDDPERIREYLQKIDSSSNYMLALLNDVLEMSRIESGKSELDIGRMSLFMLMDEAQSLFERQMAEKRIAYTVDTTAVRDGCVYGDKTRLSRVLFNLVSNAYKFTPEGGSVDVTLEQLDCSREGFARYELRVKDTGIGMSQEFALKVFDAFERERTATASGIQGTGLGMSITKNIVELMGGTIRVETEQGQGTEFIVDFELELQRNSQGENEPANPCEQRTGEVNFTGKRLLLAEDNAINREIATMVLESLGFSVDEAVDGRQALDLLVQAGPNHYDAVITDIQMPVMDGLALARAIRAGDDPALASIPIVAMSANAFQEDVKASREAGMNAHVAKPIDINVLANTLQDVLG